jgi:hypothetical protein
MNREDCKGCNSCYKNKKGVWCCDEYFNVDTRKETPISEIPYCSTSKLLKKMELN